jgi:putative NADH-flavin reductase
VKVLLLGARGRTGRLVAAELAARSHDVVPFAGDVRDGAALGDAVRGVDTVVSALGPRRGDRTLHRDVAPLLVDALRENGVRRFVGVSGAGVDVPGDRKSARDRAVSWLVHRLGGDAARDKEVEREVWAAAGLDWTLVRPPRLTDGPATGAVEHDAHISPRRTTVARADLAAFLVDVVEQGLYPGQAPFVARR